jgi:hypothetical protein
MRRTLLVALALSLAGCHGRPAPDDSDASEASTASVHIGSDPQGASIEIDGKPANATTPADLTLPAYKEYKIRLTLSGFEPWAGSVVAIANAEPVQAHLVPLLSVRIETTPAGASVTRSGAVVIESTPGSLQAPAGKVILRVEKTGYLPLEGAPVFDDAHRIWQVKLAPAAYLLVKSTPPGAEVEVDGVSTGLKTPVERLAVAAGVDHTVAAHLGALSSDLKTVRKLKPGAKGTVSLRCSDRERGQTESEIAQLQAKANQLRAQKAVLQREASRYEYKDAVRYADYLKKLEAMDDKIGEAQERADELKRDLESR